MEWPKKVEIDLTDRCNHRCSFCIYHQHDKPGEEFNNYKDMSDSTFENIIPFIKHAEKIILTGGGEQALAKKFIKRLEFIKELNPKLDLLLTTNASLFSNIKFCESVLKYIDELHISCNGLNSRERLMIGSSNSIFKRALVNISRFKKQYKKPFVTLNFIVMKENISEMIKAKVLAKKLEFDSILYLNLWITNESMLSKSVRYDKKYLNNYLTNISNAKKIDFPQKTFPVEIRDSESSIDVFSSSKKPFCGLPWINVRISTSGNAYLCSFASTFIGNINDVSPTELWNGKIAKEYRDGMKSGNYHKHCANCVLIKNTDSSLEVMKEREVHRILGSKNQNVENDVF